MRRIERIVKGITTEGTETTNDKIQMTKPHYVLTFVIWYLSFLQHFSVFGGSMM